MDDKQLTLFQHFLKPQKASLEDMSNTLMFWDSLPKYHIPREKQHLLADAHGRLPVFKREVVFQNETYVMEIQPAQVERGGAFTDVYPGETEELIEDVLRKFLADQHLGYFDPRARTARINFTLDQIRSELKRRGKARSYQEIVDALEILGSSVLTIRRGKQAVSKDVIVAVTGVTRETYLANPKSRWVAKFHDFIIGSITKLDYRQMNYGLLMEMRSPLTRYLYRRLCGNYVYADFNKPYHFLYSTLRDGTEFFRSDRVRDHITRIDTSLRELQEMGLLSSIKKDERRGARQKLEDVRYEICAHLRLRDEMIAANQTARDREQRLKGEGALHLPPPSPSRMPHSAKGW